MEATQEEIDICLEEAREKCPEATEKDIWKIGVSIYEDAIRDKIYF